MNGRPRSRLAAVSTRAGARLLRWHASIGGGDVRALALSRSRDRLYVGGWFTQVNGRAHRHLAALGTTSGATRRFPPRPAWPVSKLLLAGRSLYAAGAGNGGRIASCNVRTGSRRWLSITDGDVVALALRRGVLYAGGHFVNYCRGRAGTGHPLVCTAPAARRHLLALNARTARLTRWNPGTNSVHGVFALAASTAQVDAGGDFTLVNGARREGIARFRR